MTDESTPQEYDGIPIGIFRLTNGKLDGPIHKINEKEYRKVVSIIEPQQILFDDFDFLNNFRTIIEGMTDDDDDIKIVSDGFIARITPYQRDQIKDIIKGGVQ